MSVCFKCFNQFIIRLVLLVKTDYLIKFVAMGSPPCKNAKCVYQTGIALRPLPHTACLKHESTGNARV